MSALPQRYAGELIVGEVVARRQVKLDAQAFAAFAALTGDRHPIHYDPAYAAQRNMPGLLAHGLLVTAITALGATDFSDQLHGAMIAMLSVSADFKGPVWEGETVQLTMRVQQVEPKSRGRAVVTLMVDVTRADQPENLLAQVRQQYLMKASA